MQAEYHLVSQLKEILGSELCINDVGLIVNHLFRFHVFANSTSNLRRTDK